MPSVKNVSNDRLYDAINSMRLELKADITDLRKQFQSLEEGRLTRLEGKMSDFEVGQVRRDSIIRQNQAVLSTKFVVLSAVGIAIFNATLYYFFSRLLK